MAQGQRVPEGSAAVEPLDYSPNHRAALTRNLEDPRLPIDNNHDEQQIRSWATGRKNWRFAGLLPAGEPAAAITSLIQSARSMATIRLRNVLERLPTERGSEVGRLLPDCWSAGS
jgi:hypothetical protein